MAMYRVWAPNAKSVTLVVGDERVPMHAAESSGWWEGEHAAPPGRPYRFALDDGAPLPDPRSPGQPEGVEGPSALVAHAGFPWTDAGWRPPSWPAAVIYELHIGTFTPAGTYRAALERLDDLVELGITHVELMPVNAYSGRHGWGYDGTFFFAPHAGYGTPQELMRFVDACHGRGLAVLLDVVYNHLGPVGNILPKFGPYLTEQYKSAWGSSLNFDGADSDEVRRFVCDSALNWLRDYHFDGLRLDATHQLFDMRAVHILEQLAQEVRALEHELGRPLLLIAENDQNNARLVWPVERGGFGLDALWLDDFHHALHVLLTGETKGYYADYRGLASLAKCCRDGYANNGVYSPSRRRTHGMPIGETSGANFVVCMQNHDQVGNRALGDRISASISIDRLKIGAALVLTSPCVPLIFQGEEWAASTPFLYFTDHRSPELAEAVRKGRRAEFAAFGGEPEEIPDPQDLQTFAASKLNWAERLSSPHREVLAWYRRLLHLRREIPDLQAGPLLGNGVDFDEAAGWLVLRRGRCVVAANFATQARTVPIVARKAEVLLESKPVVVRDDAVELPAESVVILAAAPPA